MQVDFVIHYYLKKLHILSKCLVAVKGKLTKDLHSFCNLKFQLNSELQMVHLFLFDLSSFNFIVDVEQHLLIFNKIVF